MFLSPVNLNPGCKLDTPHQRQDGGFNVFREEVNRLDNQAKQNILFALSPIPTARRLGSLPDTLDEGNTSRAGGLLGLAALNLPGDIRELTLAYNKGFAKNPYQYELSFFKNTILDKLPKHLPWLDNIDNTLFNTGFGKFLRRTLGLEINIQDVSNVEGACPKTLLRGYTYTGTFAQQTLGRALHRIPVIGLTASTALEIPSLISSVTKTEGNIFDKAEAFGRQFIKSAGYIGLSTAGIAIGGALLFPQGAILGLIGMAAGSTLGILGSKVINKAVDMI